MNKLISIPSLRHLQVTISETFWEKDKELLGYTIHYVEAFAIEPEEDGVHIRLHLSNDTNIVLHLTAEETSRWNINVSAFYKYPKNPVTLYEDDEMIVEYVL